MKDAYSSFRSFMAKNVPENTSEDALKKESESLYLKKLDEETKLLELYNQKKLTNKNTIRKARAIAEKYAKKDNAK